MHATLTVSLSAIAENYRQLRARLSSGRCAAVVKSNAYGMGVVAVAPALAKAGCRDFFVATLDEGIELANVLKKPKNCQIYIIHGLVRGEEKTYKKYSLIPVLNTLEQIESLKRGSIESSLLHIDTGMNRLGLSAKELARLVEKPDLIRTANIRMVMSHLACSDAPKHKLNQTQLAKLRACAAKLPPMLISFANSSGIFLGKEYHFDLARPGCALYGINPIPEKKNPMQPVAVLKAPILQIRDLSKRESVGYDATYYAEKGDRIATVGIGYADGFFRHLSNVGHGHIGQHKVSIVGRVSMDMVMLDVTHVPDSALRQGAVEFIGKHQDVDAFAARAGTIGYEVFTRLGRRVRREYLG